MTRVVGIRRQILLMRKTEFAQRQGCLNVISPFKNILVLFDTVVV